MPTFFADPPEVDEGAARRIARNLYGLEAIADDLPSERDRNLRLETPDGRRYVLKIANAQETTSVLEAENAAMRRLASTGLTPVLVPTRSGTDIGQTGDGFRVRLITWLDGQELADAPHRSHALLEHLGTAVATIDRALEGFDHPALHRDFHWDLAAASAVIARERARIADEALRHLVDRFVSLYESTVAPRLPALRRGVIHNDANDHNVLVDRRADRVTGVVDFGDMVFSHTVNGLAVAMAYAALGEPNPLAAAARVARGYHAVQPLTHDELAVLFPLMCLRLCVSVAVAGVQQSERPDDAYLGVSQRAIRETLPRLAEVHPRLAHYRLRDACGVSPVPDSPRIVEWLRANAHIAPLTGRDLRKTPVLGLDLSVGSPLVGSDPAQNAAEPFGRRVFDAMRESGVDIAAGGYDEARVLYATDSYASGAVTDERRTIHIGIDLTLVPGSPIYAPLDGVVHGFMDASQRLDYGPVIVLRHDVADAHGPLTFFTLYGHLETSALEGLEVGAPVAAGEQFASIGAPPSNGDWWPHLHFQVIADMLDVPCNFNGVAPAGERTTWLSICPDPNLLLGIPPERFARHASTSELLAARRERFGRNLSVSYGAQPLQLSRGWMQYVFDETGRTYIDAYNNVPHVGHSHPAVVRAAASQLATLNTNTRYLQEAVLEYATALVETFPPPLRVCFFTASGTEANELALRLARAHTRSRDLVVMDAAYHGHTTTLIDISPYKHNGPGGEGTADWVHVSPVPDVYRGAHKSSDPDAGLKFAREVGTVIDRIREQGRALCGYIAETCPSVGGQIMLPSAFLPEVYRFVRAAGGLAIADEVQTGFGRIGTHFWAFEQHGVVPDIVVLGKPMANGYPMGAVVTTREIADSFANGMEFFSTFGGSTAACAAGLATLRATIDENLQAHGLAVGRHLLAALHQLQVTHDLIGDVRGSGLFIGVELVRDRRTLQPATGEAAAIVNRMRELGVLTGTDGPHHNVVKIRGPMPLTIADADIVAHAFARALAEV